MNFNDFNLSSNILKAISKLGFVEPTLIQELTIPEALSGRDIVGQSQTVTGKTAAFGLPIIQNIRPGKGLQALVLTPTRELCLQVANALQDYSSFSRIRVRSVFGGVGYDHQIKALKEVEIIVATPGRLYDHIDSGNADLSTIRFLVLDEADKMFEMGFLEDVERIISYVPKKRQVFLFSATFPNEVESLMEKYLDNPAFLETEPFVSEKYLKQSYYETSSDSKFSILLHLLKEPKKDLTSIIFCATRKETDFLYQNLKNNGIRALPLHGGHTQANRQKSIDLLHEGKIKVLVATDVAARGLDIRNVNCIFNWDIPPTPHEYVHRIGRTARAGDVGNAISLVTIKDIDSFSRILEQQDYNVEQKHIKEYTKVRMIRGRSNNRPTNKKSNTSNRNNFRTKFDSKPRDKSQSKNQKKSFSNNNFREDRSRSKNRKQRLDEQWTTY